MKARLRLIGAIARMSAMIRGFVFTHDRTIDYQQGVRDGLRLARKRLRQVARRRRLKAMREKVKRPTKEQLAAIASRLASDVAFRKRFNGPAPASMTFETEEQAAFAASFENAATRMPKP